MIDELNQLYNNNSNLINLISILFGIAGTILGIITWRDSKKSKKSYEYLFELAEKNIDKSVTDQQLSEKKKEIQEASQRIEALQEQIRKDIPIEARRTILKDKLNSQIELLKQHFDSSKKIRDELAKMGDTPEIPQDLLKTIENEISPEYILHEQRSKKMTELTIVSSAAAIASTILPYPMGKWISWTMLFLAIPILLSLIKYSYSRNQINNFINFFLVGFGIVTLFIGFIIGMSRIYLSNINEEGSFIFMLLFFGFSIISFSSLLWKKKFKINSFYKINNNKIIKKY